MESRSSSALGYWRWFETTKFIELMLLTLLFTTRFVSLNQSSPAENAVVQGVWDNFDFSMPAQDWSSAAKRLGGKNSLVDLVIAQARDDGLVSLPFPYKSSGSLISVNDIDLVEPYLERFDSDGVKVILSIQPLANDVSNLIDMILNKYGEHESIIGINVDIEWKESGTSNHVSDAERDEWLGRLNETRTDLKLFLTYFGSYRNFPGDSSNMVVLFDGENDTQANILNRYRELASHFSSVGIYTGYYSSVPPTASNDRIVATVPKTNYIIHVNALFHVKPTLIFELDNVQAGWLESTTLKLMDLHIQKDVPVVLGVIPANLTNPREGTGILPKHLKNLYTNYKDIFEIGQEGYSDDESGMLKGKSQQEQEKIIDAGYGVLTSIGINPVTFIPPQGSMDNTTVKILEQRGFQVLINLFENASSDKLLIFDSWISLTETIDNTTEFKSPDQIMNEILNIADRNAVIISYEINDFQNETGKGLEQLSNILSALKGSGKYQFMTPTQYKISLSEEIQAEHSQSESQWQNLLNLAPYILIGTILIAILVFIIRRMKL